MKKLVILFLAALPLVACNANADKENGDDQSSKNDTTATKQEKADSTDPTGSYGAAITAENAISLTELQSQLKGKDSVTAKVEGKIGEVCQMKGCWMTMPVGDENMRISFKDYGFFVPKNCSGYDAVMKGVAKKQTVSVEDLKHFAKDAGKSEEEIAAITEPEENLVFVAEGVIIR